MRRPPRPSSRDYSRASVIALGWGVVGSEGEVDDMALCMHGER